MRLGSTCVTYVTQINACQTEILSRLVCVVCLFLRVDSIYSYKQISDIATHRVFLFFVFLNEGLLLHTVSSSAMQTSLCRQPSL